MSAYLPGQQNVLKQTTTSFLGLEATTGVPPLPASTAVASTPAPGGTFPKQMVRLLLDDSGLDVDGLKYDMIPNPDEDPRRAGDRPETVGLKRVSTLSATVQIKNVPSAAALTAGGSVLALSHRLLWLAAFANEWATALTAGPSIVTDAGNSTTAVLLVNPTDFLPGTWIACDTAGTGAQGLWEVTCIDKIVAGIATCSPPLSHIPTAANHLVNLFTYAPGSNHRVSFTFAHCYAMGTALTTADYAGHDDQFELRGVALDTQFSFGEMGKTFNYKLAGKVISWSPPGPGSYSVEPAADDMDAALPTLHATVFLGARSPATRPTNTVVTKLAFTVPQAWSETRDAGATSTESLTLSHPRTEAIATAVPDATPTLVGATYETLPLTDPTTVSGWVNTSTRPKVVTCELTLLVNQAEYYAITGAEFGSGPASVAGLTPRRLTLINQTGFGAHTQFLIWDLPQAVLTEVPKVVDYGQGRLGLTLMFKGTPDVRVAGAPTFAAVSAMTAAGEFLDAPVRFAAGSCG